MRKACWFLLGFLIIGSYFALSGGVGTYCDYFLNRDSQCDIANSIYCTSYSCQVVSDTILYCIDTDANNLTVSGDLNARYRDYDGRFSNISVGDDCINANLFVSSCSGSLCKVREATCISDTNGSYAFADYPCNSCSNGACLSSEYQQQSIIGKSCNYQVSGDSQCDTANGIYCTAYSCQSVSDTNTYCADTDANNLTAFGTVNRRQRSYDGSWLLSTITDSCMQGNTIVSSCTGTDCKLQEVTCSGIDLNFQAHSCTSCNNGACASLQGDANASIGKACSYSSSQDSFCNPDSNIFCISNVCTRLDQNVSAYCIDSDDKNYFKPGDLNYFYRDYSNGQLVKGSARDQCIDANTLREFYCLNRDFGINYDSNSVKCVNGCSNGVCASLQQQAIGENCTNGIKDYDESGVDCGGAYCQTCQAAEIITDELMLQHISQWAQGQIDNARILELIEAWKGS